MQRSHRRGRRHCFGAPPAKVPLRRVGRCLGAAVAALAIAAARPAAASFEDLSPTVYLGMEGASFAGGTVDAATGAALFHVGFGSIMSHVHVPVSGGLLWQGQDNSAGPFGPGTFTPYDWCLWNNFGAGFDLVGPGNRRYAFTVNQGGGNWIDTRDPEMLGAVLTVNWTNADPLRWKDGTVWHFDSLGTGGLVDVIDPHGQPVIAHVSRDPNSGRTLTVNVDGLTNSRNINYIFSGSHVVGVTVNYSGSGPTPVDKGWTFTYGGWDGNEVSTITDPLGHVTHLSWTGYTRSDGKLLPLLSSVTNARGNLVYSNQYDGSGRVIKQTYADSGYTSASYGMSIGQTGITTVTDPKGGVRQYGCVWEPAANGHEEGYHLAWVIDALGRQTIFDQLAPPSLLTTRITDYRGRYTFLTWDTAKGNLTSRSWTTPASQTATQSWSYDPATSAVTATTDVLGRTATRVVNAGGDVTSSTDARNNTTTFTPNNTGYTTTVTNALHQMTSLTYGPNGELLTTTDPLNHTTTRTYDPASRLLSTQDANGKTVNLTYDLMDRLLTQSQTVGGQVLTTTNVYDADGDRIQMTDPKAQVWQWSFDNMDRVASETDPLGHSITYSYDLNGNVSGWTDRNGNSAAFTYDAENRPLTKTYTKVGGAPDSTVTYNYDATTHLLTSIVDSAAPGSQTWSYTYDSLDRLTAVTTPYGTVTAGLNDKLDRRDSLQAGAQGIITYGFDNNDNLTSITQNGATASLTYDALNRLTQQSLPATPNPVSTTRVFDAAGFLTSVTSSRNGTTLDSHSYTRDAVGNILQETIGGQTNSTSTFGYDDLYRLTSATVNGVSYGWTYDQVGNRLTQTTGSVTDTYTYDAADHLQSIDGYTIGSDLNGNVTSDVSGGTYTWDVRGRLVGRVTGKIGRVYAYQYGPDNLRVSKSVSGVLSTYLLDGEQVVTDTIGGTANQTLYGPGIDHPLARNGEYFLANHQGSTTALTDSSGTVVQSYAYYPFGQLISGTTDSNPFQFTGREDDGDSLIYYRARYYQPNWGRFLSADPLSVGGAGDLGHQAGDEMGMAAEPDAGASRSAFGIEETTGAVFGRGALERVQPSGVPAAGPAWAVNPYVYAGNDPVNNTDPSGAVMPPPISSLTTPAGYAVLTEMAIEESEENGVPLYETSQWAGPWELHHIFPMRFVTQFTSILGQNVSKRILIEVPQWWNDWVHTQQGFVTPGGWWNYQWQQWLAQNPRASAQQAWAFANQLLAATGVRGIRIYWK